MSGGGGHVEEGSAASTDSATSDDFSAHVHFREEDSGHSRRRSSIMEFMKQHIRSKRSKIFLDSKQKSDELAGRRLRGKSLQAHQTQGKQNKRTGLHGPEIAELAGTINCVSVYQPAEGD